MNRARANSILVGALVSALPALSFAGGIDFTAIERGRQQALEDNQRDLKRQQELDAMRRQNEEREYESAADRFLSQLPKYRQEALARGVTPDAFWLANKKALFADATFQSFPPKLQMLIVRKFGEMHDMFELGNVPASSYEPSPTAGVNGYGNSKQVSGSEENRQNNWWEWERATNIGESTTGDFSITRCSYKTNKGYEFSINARGSCPASVEVDPVSNRLRTGERATASPNQESLAESYRWQNANNIGQTDTGDPGLTRCNYKTLGGYEFSVNARGHCPQSVEVDPLSQKVRQSR